MTWNSRNFYNWRIVRRVKIVENWIRNVWIQKNSNNNWISVNNNIFTKFLNNSSKNIDINISFDKKFDRFRKNWFNCRISKIECKTTKREIRNDYNNYNLFDFFIKFFDFTMFDWKKIDKIRAFSKWMLITRNCW